MWSLSPYETSSRYFDPMDRMMRDFFNEANRTPRSLRSLRPYWLERQTPELTLGNAIGNVVNDREKFSVDVDVSQFRPEELSVNVRDNDLVIEGHHEERSDETGTIERHFIRKYTLPEDANLENVESSLSDHGVLTVYTPKLAIESKKGRTIPIQAVPHQQAKIQQAPEKQPETSG